MKNLAIIPARKGSKGIPNKNIKKIAGKPLIAWTIESALQSKNVSRVIVSTDCEHIAEISKQYGAEVPFLRPAYLASDTSATEPVVSHTLKWLKEEDYYIPDNIILLQCTSPFRNKKSIDNAINEFTISQADSLLSLSEFWHFLWENKSEPCALYDFNNRPRRQDVNTESIKYKENGSIYITKTSMFVKHKNRLCGKIASYVMSEAESFEIDNQLDWLILESILKHWKAE
tara:strand:+ start:35279 stop:35968 length:690 start_codon:yes stop_codon:yes gene_type:complete